MRNKFMSLLQLISCYYYCCCYCCYCSGCSCCQVVKLSRCCCCCRCCRCCLLLARRWSCHVRRYDNCITLQANIISGRACAILAVRTGIRIRVHGMQACDEASTQLPGDGVVVEAELTHDVACCMLHVAFIIVINVVDCLTTQLVYRCCFFFHALPFYLI